MNGFRFKHDNNLTLIWEINFVRAIDGEQKIMFSRTYENGVQKKMDLGDIKEIFINYVTAFPNKDIVRIKLGIENQYLYTFYYIDKSHFDRGFLGVFGVSEYNTTETFEWPEIELLQKYLYGEYYKRLEDGRILSPEGSQEYLDWLDEQVRANYNELCNARGCFYRDLNEKKKNTLAEAFFSAAAASDEKKSKEKSKSEWEKATASLKLREIIPKQTEAIKQYADLSETDKKWLNLGRRWEFQLINAYGNPLTRIMTFVNGELKQGGSEEQDNMQSLEGMSYSVLRSFVEQQKLRLKNMKIRTAWDQGFEFILFHNFHFKELAYMIIMNVVNFDPASQINLDLLKGDEELVLNRVVTDMQENHKDWFDDKGELVNNNVAGEIENLMYRHCRNAFRDLKG